MTNNILPLGDNILIRRIAAKEEIRTSGIIVPEAVTQKEPMQKAVIVAVSEDLVDKGCRRLPGDIVLTYLRNMTPVNVEGEDMALVRINDIQAWLPSSRAQLPEGQKGEKIVIDSANQ